MKPMFLYILVALLVTVRLAFTADNSLPGYRGLLWGTALNEAQAQIQEMFSNKAGVDTSLSSGPKIAVEDSLTEKAAEFYFFFTPLTRKFKSVMIVCKYCETSTVKAILTNKYGQPLIAEQSRVIWDFGDSETGIHLRQDEEIGLTITYMSLKFVKEGEAEIEEMKLRQYKEKGKDEF